MQKIITSKTDGIEDVVAFFYPGQRHWQFNRFLVDATVQTTDGGFLTSSFVEEGIPWLAGQISLQYYP